MRSRACRGCAQRWTRWTSCQLPSCRLRKDVAPYEVAVTIDTRTSGQRLTLQTERVPPEGGSPLLHVRERRLLLISGLLRRRPTRQALFLELHQVAEADPAILRRGLDTPLVLGRLLPFGF